MGYFISIDVNPMPTDDTADRNWLALDQSGFILPSHGMTVPVDSSSQPNRGYASNPGNFTVPRFGWPGAYLAGYAADVARDLQVVDWKPDAPGGYMMDSYGSLWPFGNVPIAPTDETGAPFGLFPLPAFRGAVGTCMNVLQMHSANGKPFGLDGYADGFGYMMSMDGVIINWGGPITGLRSPYLDLNLGSNPNGVPGASGNNCVRDWKVNPDGGGVHYTLFRTGFVYSGSAVGGAPQVITGAQADGGSGTTPNPAMSFLTDNGWRWMYVKWGQWIIIVHTSGDTWGLRIAGGTEPIPPTLNAGSQHPSWWAGATEYYQDGAIIPPSNPSRFWQVANNGAVRGDLLAGTPTLSAVNVTGNTTTTQPTLRWTWNETFGVSMRDANIRVYTQAYIAAQVALGAFVPGQNAGAIHINDPVLKVATGAVGTNLISTDLLNGTAYTAYVRGTSAAAVTTGWSTVNFTLTITPAVVAPTSVTATAHPIVAPPPPIDFGYVSIAAGGSLGAGEKWQFQVSVEGDPWHDVLGAEASSSASVNHTIAPTNQTLVYRVRKFKRIPGLVAGPWTLSNAVVLNPQSGLLGAWQLVDPNAVGGPANPLVVPISVVAGSYEVERTEVRSEFQGLTADFMVVEGRVKGTVHKLTVQVFDRASFKALWGILGIERSIILLTTFGTQWWVRATPGTYKMMRAQPLASEIATGQGIRHYHNIDIRLVQTAPAVP